MASKPFHMLASEIETRRRSGPVEGERIRLGGELVDLSELIPIYGSSAVGSLLDSAAKAFQAGYLKYPGRQSRALKVFLRYASVCCTDGHEQPRSGALYARILAGEVATHHELMETLQSFDERLRDVDDLSISRSTKQRTRSGVVECTIGTLRAFSEFGHWERLGRTRLGTNNNRKYADHIPSLGEMVVRHPLSGDLGHTAHMHGVQQLNRQRIDGLRDVLSEVFQLEWRKFKEGQALAQSPNLPAFEIIQRAVQELPRYYNPRSTDTIHTVLVKRCFPGNDLARRRGCLLKYVLGLPGDRLPIWKEESGLPALILSCGGKSWLADCLGGNGSALAAAHGIILIDTGFNIQPCDDLLANPITMQAKRGLQTLSTITSNKMRSGGKIVAAVLAEYEAEVPVRVSDGKISAIEVINRWREMSDIYRRRAPASLKKNLWLRPSGRFGTEDIQVAPNAWAHFRALNPHIQKHVALKGLQVARRNIRPSVLQLRLGDGSLDTVAVASVGGHGSQSVAVRSYLNRGWFTAQMDELIRTFQNRLEAALLGADFAVESLVALNAEVHAARRQEAVETGLGLFCVGQPSVSSPGAQACLALERCASCTSMRFSPTDSALRALVVTEKSLSAAAEEFCAQNPERWAHFWLPTLALVRAIGERLSQGHWKKKFETVRDDVERQLVEGDLALVRPW